MENKVVSLRVALVLLFTLFLISCDAPQEEAHKPKVQIRPAVLDFGTVRATVEPIVLSFDIENKSSQPLTIDRIFPSCGCTMCDLPSNTIPANGSLTASIKVFLNGRSGDFNHDVLIKIAEEDFSLSLPIKGFIDRDLFFSGQTIRCTADKIDRVAETQFDITVRNLSDIDFDDACFLDGVQAKEVAREPTQEGFVLRMSLRIQVPVGQDSYGFDLLLCPKSSDVLPLEIPVQCFVAQ